MHFYRFVEHLVLLRHQIEKSFSGFHFREDVDANRVEHSLRVWRTLSQERFKKRPTCSILGFYSKQSLGYSAFC